MRFSGRNCEKTLSSSIGPRRCDGWTELANALTESKEQQN